MALVRFCVVLDKAHSAIQAVVPENLAVNGIIINSIYL